jgi:low temperature requirement protein LtrA
MWWVYFILPSGPILQLRRDRLFGCGYGHIALFGALVAVGAGLHVAALQVEHASVLGTSGTVLTVAVPVALYVASIYLLNYQLLRACDPLYLVLLGGSAIVVAGSIALSAAGVPTVWCLAALSLAPWVSVVGYETVGYRRGERMLEEL